MLTISVNADANISNRFETDYELGTVMSIESMLKSCLKHVQLWWTGFKQVLTFDSGGLNKKYVKSL